MSKAEKFILESTNQFSNEDGFDYIPWLTPDQAREAVEIAREEIYKWLANHYRDYMYNPTGKKLEAFFGMDMINDLKQAMKDE
jgi:hypothetical protein